MSRRKNKEQRKRSLEEIGNAAKFEQNELDFINKIAKQAFTGKRHRPYVYVGICCAILENIQLLSEDPIDKETLMKFVEMGTENITLEKKLEIIDRETAKEPGKTFGECESCGTKTVLVAEVGLCGPCCFGEADTINGNW